MKREDHNFLSVTEARSRLLQVIRDISEAEGEIALTRCGAPALQRDLAGLRSLRVGGYRGVYRVDETQQTIDVLYLGKRWEVYESLRELLLSPRTK